MRRFRFPLARLERLRRHHETLAQRELAERAAVVAALDNRLETVAANVEACQRQDGPARAFGEALRSGLATLARRLESKRVDAIAEVEFARARYAEKRRDVQTLSRLHEQRRVEWRAEIEHAEQAELDETARLLFAARRGARR